MAVDVKDVLDRFITDVIASCSFGIDCNSFEDRDTLFWRKRKRIPKLRLLRNQVIGVFVCV